MCMFMHIFYIEIRLHCDAVSLVLTGGTG